MEKMKTWKKRWCILLAAMFCTAAFGNPQKVSYAAKGDLGEGYGADNLDAEFTTVDGRKVSSRSEGIVTVLLFARTDGRCSNSTSAIQSLCNSSWIQNKDMRLIIVDIDQHPAETVRAVQKENENDAVMFCYDESSAASGTMFRYLQNTAGAGSGVTLPVTVIIDKTNKVQYCRTGNFSANEIYSYVAELADWSFTEESGNGKVNVYVEGTFDEEQAFQVLEQVNKAKTAQGKNPLKMDKILSEKAMQRAAECSVYYSHTRPNGERCFSILESPYTMGCAENIAAGYRNADEVMTGWLNSSGHYANIMNADYESIGIGCFYQDGVRYWAQLFSVYSGTEKNTGTNSVKKVAVEAASDYLGSLFLSYQKQELQAGETAAPILKLTNLGFGFSTPSVDTITFQSSDEAVAKVDKDGTLHAYAEGTAVITAVLDDTVKAEYTVTVKQGTQNIPDVSARPSIKPEASRLPSVPAGPSDKPENSDLPEKPDSPAASKNPAIPTKGDVTGDAKVTLADAQLVLKAALNLASLNDNQKKAADIDGNDRIELKDAQMILKVALNLASF